ncbi:DMT family transporter [Halorussus salinus]|uniref:DMT family transporter n=1 Tax=Halorussus salinus TaxID=1364935 RepID=UPI001EE42F4D|nr:DMT family transporter [Halorussus salinus]
MSRTRDLTAFAVMTLLFGGAFPAIEVGLRYLPPLALAAVRYAVSAALLLGYALATTDYWRPRTRADWLAVLAGGVFFIGGSGLTFVGQQFTTAGVAAIVFSAIPILTVLVGAILLPEETVSPRGALGLVVGFLGVAIVVGPDPATLGGDAGASAAVGDGSLELGAFATALLGPALVFAAAVSVTLGTVLVRRFRPSMPTVSLTGAAMAVGAAIQAGLSLALGEEVPVAGLALPALLAVAYLAVFASGVGFVVYFDLLSRVGPLEVNLVSYLVPVVSVGVGWWLLDEPVYSSTLVGFGVVVAGFVLLKNRELAAELAKYRGAAR